MLAAGSLLSVALPLLAGLPWLLALQAQRVGRWPLAIAYGYVLGLLVLVAGMRILYLVHVPVNLLTAGTLPVVVAAFGWWRMRDAPAVAAADRRVAMSTWQAMSTATRIVCAAALALIALRLLTLGAELLLRPIFPWESVSAVASKARVWYEAGAMSPFVAPAAWLE